MKKLGVSLSTARQDANPADLLITESDASALAADVVHQYARTYQRSGGNPVTWDYGVPWLASAGIRVGVAEGHCRQLAETWLRRAIESKSLLGVGLFGGLTGAVLCLKALSPISPSCGERCAEALALLEAQVAMQPWAPSARSWSDYDLTRGPAGVVLGLLSIEATGSPALEMAVEHLVRLVTPDLELLKVEVQGSSTDPKGHGFNIGRVNTGLAHGAAGVLLALASYSTTREGRRSSGVEAAISMLCEWFWSKATAERGHGLAWPCAEGVGPDEVGAFGLIDRQAWCYGTPGITWALYRGHIALSQPSAAQDALKTFLSCPWQSYPSAYSGISICHGIAGIALLSSAFERSCPQANVSTVTKQVMRECSSSSEGTTEKKDWPLLQGAAGVVAVVLAARGDMSGVSALGIQ